MTRMQSWQGCMLLPLCWVTGLSSLPFSKHLAHSSSYASTCPRFIISLTWFFRKSCSTSGEGPFFLQQLLGVLSHGRRQAHYGHYGFPSIGNRIFFCPHDLSIRWRPCSHCLREWVSANESGWDPNSLGILPHSHGVHQEGSLAVLAVWHSELVEGIHSLHARAQPGFGCFLWRANLPLSIVASGGGNKLGHSNAGLVPGLQTLGAPDRQEYRLPGIHGRRRQYYLANPLPPAPHPLISLQQSGFEFC